MNETDQLSFMTKDWSPIPYFGRHVPWGYEIDPDDPGQLLPVVFELEALEKAKIHLKQYSLRDVAQWLTELTGRYISHMGLKKRVNSERHRRRKAQTIKRWAKRYEEAISKAEAFEAKGPGAGKALAE